MVSRGTIKLKSWENRLKRRPESDIKNQGQKREGLEFLDPGPEVHVEACLQSFPKAHGEVPRKPFCGLRRPSYSQFNAEEARMVWEG